MKAPLASQEPSRGLQPARTFGHLDRSGAFRCNPLEILALSSAAKRIVLAEGMGLAEAVSFAVAAASLSVTRDGAQDSMPARADVDAFVAGW